MKLNYINKINFKKLKAYKARAMFLIIPITFLMLIGVVVSSQAKNILNASEQAIFGTAAESSRLIELTSNQFTGGGEGDRRVQLMFGGNTDYTENDINVIYSIENIESVALTIPVPISQIKTNALFDGNEVFFNNIHTLDEALSAQYTDQNFNYTEGEPIPIILNSQSLIRTYEDWNGQEEIAIDMSSLHGLRNTDRISIENGMPFKTEAIAYDRDKLLGQEFTISFGGLDPIQTFETEFTGTGILFRKLSDEEIQVEDDARREALSAYWDYDKLSKPLNFTFKVVGVLETEGNFASYIPETFVYKLMDQYVQNQLDARTEVEIPTSDLNATFYGMTYDGLELQASGFGGMGIFHVGIGLPRDMIGASGDDETAQNSYTIPGLIIETVREEGNADAFQQRMFGGSSEVLGIYSDPTVFNQASHTSGTLVLRILDPAYRTQVVKDLNDAGYAYQDLNDQEVFSELQDTMSNAITVVTISFIVLSAIIIILTMGKFVSESTKEIGVFRAIGAKKKDIKQLFMSQAVLYTLIGYIIGGLLGLGLVLVLAKPIQLWFDSFIENTVEETFTVVQTTSAGVFTHIDWTMFGLYSVLLLLIALVVSIIPATRASRVSPVEAIRSE